VVEKPIGHDLASARELDHIARGIFDEPDVFRIDHYLGREAVQNIMVFRFANSMVERAWCGEGVDRGSCTMRSPAIGRSSCARTRSSVHGRSSLPYSSLPAACTPTPRGPGDRVLQTS
jgi:hypothetical protein